MSNNDKWVKMETMRTNSNSNKSNNKDPGIYTCPTCNALFTCLKFYQQHVTQHAEVNGTKLFCCNICRFSTEQLFQFNWHSMSHKDQAPHSCSVCQDKSSGLNSNNHLNGGDSVTAGKNTRKSQQNGNSNKKAKYSNSKEEEDSDDSDDESGEMEAEEDETEESGTEEEDEDEEDEEEEVDEETESDQMQVQNQYPNANQVDQSEDISDDDEDDEEEEVESEVEDGDNLPEEYLVAQRLNNESNYQYSDMQSSNLNNNSTSNNISDAQVAPYTKSSANSDLPDINEGIICNKGRGKGNRKSRTINQMGGQVDDELSQLRRKFHCSHCGKSFKTKSHLQRHILTHTGEKPYHCNRCGAKFNQSSSLRNHIIALHTKEYPHFCERCNKGFLMPALLQKHLQTSHKDDPSA